MQKYTEAKQAHSHERQIVQKHCMVWRQPGMKHVQNKTET